MPNPGEIRIIDGKAKVWIPASASSGDVTATLAIPHRKTLSIRRENFELSGEISILNIEGTGELREIVIVANNKINMIPKIDGVDMLYGRNRYDEFSTASVHSKTIEARYDDPNYIVGLNNIHFLNTVDIRVLFDSLTVISNLICIYDVYGDK